MTQPAHDDGNGPEHIEPTADEIARAADDEARAEKAAKRTPSTPRRGPGRPAGSKNRKPDQSAAKDRGKATTASVVRPPTGAAARSVEEAQRRSREERQRQRDERNENIKTLTAEAMRYRPGFVKGVGVATGLPPQFLVGHAANENGEIQPGPDGKPVEVLTAYGEQLAPSEWQVKACVSAYVRLEETPQGQALMERFDKYVPWLLCAAAVGALGIYTVSIMQTSQAIKPMIAAEIQQMQAAQAAARQPPTPGASSSGGAAG